MTRIRTFLLVAACAAPALGLAQWQWIDSAGRRVFSDQPPPPNVPEKNIVQQPVARPATITLEAPPPPAPPRAPAASGAARTGASAPEAEARRRAEEAEKRKADEERLARQREDNCKRARSAKATLDSGARVVRMNDKGEREVMDDAARASEVQRLQEIIGSECAAP